MRSRLAISLLLACAAGPMAVPAAATPTDAVGPAAGQIVQVAKYKGSNGLVAGVRLSASSTDAYESLRGVVASDPTVDETGALANAVASADLESSGSDDGTVAGFVQLERVTEGVHYWQVVGDDGATAPVPFELRRAAPEAPPELPATRSMLAPSGYRGMRVGQTLRQARSASHLPLRLSRELTPGCRQASAPGRKLDVMFLRGRLARVASGYRNTKVDGLGGIGPGDPVTRVTEVFGRSVITTGHTYVPGGWYWDVRYAAGAYKGRAIRYVSDAEGVVEDVIVGRPDAVTFVEGCL